MEKKKIFTAENITKAMDSLFCLEHFLKWEGVFVPGVTRFIDCWEVRGSTLRIYVDGGHYDVPVGGWITKAPDGKTYAFGPGVSFVGRVDENLGDEVPRELSGQGCEPDDVYETEGVEVGGSYTTRYVRDKDGNLVLKKFADVPSPDVKWEEFRKKVERWTKK